MKLKLYHQLIIGVFFLLFALVSTSYALTDKDEVRTQVGTPPSFPGSKAPPAPSDVKQGIFDTFGITMNDFDSDHLLWTWERLWEAGTGFTQHLRGTTIQSSSGISFATNGCFSGNTSLYLGQYSGPAFFKFIVLHELGHVFQACNPRSVTRQVEQMNAYDSEGGVSFYAQNATKCFTDGSVSNYNEDYADMLAYFIDRSAGFASGPSNCAGQPPSPPNPYDVGYPKHLGVSQSILQ